MSQIFKCAEVGVRLPNYIFVGENSLFSFGAKKMKQVYDLPNLPIQ
jgi:hypothetical protein